MRIVITGGAGFLGSRLARAILARGALTDAHGETHEVRELLLLDVAAAQVDDARVRVVTGDLADPALIERVCAKRAAGTSCPTSRFSITVRGDETQMRVESATGHGASRPLSGSRMTLLAKEDAALFGLPGRTVIVGRRKLRPSM